eukprot:364372-Chlamydomonas_euryale.AAC.3
MLVYRACTASSCAAAVSARNTAMCSALASAWTCKIVGFGCGVGTRSHPDARPGAAWLLYPPRACACEGRPHQPRVRTRAKPARTSPEHACKTCPHQP